MSRRWFFQMDGDAVDMICRVEGDGGTVGDARSWIEPTDKILNPPGLTYEALRSAGSGVLDEYDDGTFRIIPAGAELQPDDVTDRELRETFASDLTSAAGL